MSDLSGNKSSVSFSIGRSVTDLQCAAEVHEMQQDSSRTAKPPTSRLTGSGFTFLPWLFYDTLFLDLQCPEPHPVPLSRSIPSMTTLYAVHEPVRLSIRPDTVLCREGRKAVPGVQLTGRESLITPAANTNTDL
ncbi:MAG: hypothetical protein MZV63_08590 [Marinilabiliales bacterium]|nr:hypothetical protein [Marinilabiliales bacterium]